MKPGGGGGKNSQNTLSWTWMFSKQLRLTDALHDTQHLQMSVNNLWVPNALVLCLLCGFENSETSVYQTENSA